MKIDQINSAIVSSNFNIDELDSIVAAVKYARARLGQKVKQGLAVGDNVNFTSRRNGRNYTGVVIKVAIKYVTVETVDGLWKVPASMLTKIEDEFVA